MSPQPARVVPRRLPVRWHDRPSENRTTREQIIEAILQLTFYAGGAAVRNALVHVKDILNSGAAGEDASSASFARGQRESQVPSNRNIT
jgi:hypothetical protein